MIWKERAKWWSGSAWHFQVMMLAWYVCCNSSLGAIEAGQLYQDMIANIGRLPAVTLTYRVYTHIAVASPGGPSATGQRLVQISLMRPEYAVREGVARLQEGQGAVLREVGGYQLVVSEGQSMFQRDAEVWPVDGGVLYLRRRMPDPELPPLHAEREVLPMLRPLVPISPGLKIGRETEVLTLSQVWRGAWRPLFPGADAVQDKGGEAYVMRWPSTEGGIFRVHFARHVSGSKPWLLPVMEVRRSEGDGVRELRTNYAYRDVGDAADPVSIVSEISQERVIGERREVRKLVELVHVSDLRDDRWKTIDPLQAKRVYDETTRMEVNP